MVFFNHATRQMTTKIVYYGPGLCGKTTNLNTIYGRTSQKARGEMVSLNTETDRTLFFDLLPMDVGMVGGFKTKLQLYTVPGQVFYNSTRKLVLKGVDGIVFVADSQQAMLDANRESYQNLRDNLRELGLELRDLPLIFQWNKRDLKNIVPVEVLERELNPERRTSFQSIASDGTGVFETLRGITKLALANIKALHMADAAGSRTPRAVPPPAPVALTASDFTMPEVLPEALPAPEIVLEPVLEPAPAPEAPAPEALHTTDLAPYGDFFDAMDKVFEARQEGPAPAPVPPPPAAAPAPAAAAPAPPASVRPAPPAKPAGPIQVMQPMHVKLAPAVPGKSAPAFPRVNLKAPVAQAAHHAPPTAAWVPPVPHQPKAPPARSHADLLLTLSSLAQDGDLEVVVTIRQNGMDVGGGTVHHLAPQGGTSGVLAVELRRS